MKKFISLSLIVFFLLSTSLPSFGQNFVNGGLEGAIQLSAAPPGWTMVPYTDNVCTATSPQRATPDITGPSGPLSQYGIKGMPFSGNSFVSGENTSTASQVAQEGIMQTVNGFTIGQSYTLEFYQSVVKQTTAYDNTGSWIVYADNVLIGITASSTSYLAVQSTYLIWEYRTISFVATSNSHTFKFLPLDDDSNNLTPNGVRMGIDDIAIQNPLPTNLIEFNTEVNSFNNNVLLNWTTASETKSDVFIVEKSRNLIDWVAVHSIEAAGESNQILNYDLQDSNPYEGISYYRLKQLDIDGKERAYSPKSVHIYNTQLRASPNPFQEYINIVVHQSDIENVHVFNLQGVAVECNITSTGTNLFTLETSSWKKGVYFIESNGLTLKVVKN